MNRQWTRNFGSAMTLASALALPLAACSDDGPMAPGAGTVEVVVHDGGSPAGAPPALQQTSGSSLSGEFRANARVQVFVDGGWQDLSGLASLDIRAQLQGGESTVASTSVEARTYQRVRIVLQNARSDLDGSSDVGLGPIGVSVRVDVAGGGEVVVERAQALTVQADGTTRLVLQLNSDAWLDENSVSSRAVARAAFESAAQIAVQ